MFDDERREKWRAGRVERGLEDSEAFHGDAAKEIQEEAMDLANYGDQLFHEGRITNEEAIRIHSTALEIYEWAKRV